MAVGPLTHVVTEAEAGLASVQYCLSQLPSWFSNERDAQGWTPVCKGLLDNDGVYLFRSSCFLFQEHVRHSFLFFVVILLRPSVHAADLTMQKIFHACSNGGVKSLCALLDAGANMLAK